MSNKPNGSKCMDCGVETVEHTPESCHDYYMLREDVWLSIVPARRGMLCIPCVEARLGRTLSRPDFANVPLHFIPGMCSERVLGRFNRRA